MIYFKEMGHAVVGLVSVKSVEQPAGCKFRQDFCVTVLRQN